MIHVWPFSMGSRALCNRKKFLNGGFSAMSTTLEEIEPVPQSFPDRLGFGFTRQSGEVGGELLSLMIANVERDISSYDER